MRAPPRTTSTSTISFTPSKSHESCGVNWKYHFIRPVATSSASTEFEYRFTPGRTPANHGPGLPVPQNSVRVSGSYDPVIQVSPPPRRYIPGGQVVPPGSLGAGIVQRFHTRLPVT